MRYLLSNRDRIVSLSYDQWLLWVTLALLGIGLVMVYSASIALAEASKAAGHQSAYYLVRHAVYLGIAVLAALLAFQIPTARWQQMAPYLFLVSLGLLVLVLIPGIGREVNGSRRWISLLVINLQPSELMKLFAALYVADYTVRKAAFMDSFARGFLPVLAVMVVTSGLLLFEPDFGAFAVVAAIAIGILWLGGMDGRIFSGLMVLLATSVVMLIVFFKYRYLRVIGFLDPWADPFGNGYQLSHSLIAFGRGEWTGVGLGASVEKLLYLPEPHTDFLLAVIAEEMGFAGVTVIILLFAWLVLRSFVIGRKAAGYERYFSALLAQGIGIWMGVQAIINIGVNMGLLPTKGLTLPLLSFGGSGIVANCIAMAILLRVDWENRRLDKGVPA